MKITKEEEKERYRALWRDIPVGRENAIDYPMLCLIWSSTERKVREILHYLSSIDNGDDYVLIRSGRTKGFYKTNDVYEIESYKHECLNKGRSIFAPLKKCNRLLKTNSEQMKIDFEYMQECEVMLDE